MYSSHRLMQSFSIVPPFDFSVGCKSYIQDRMYSSFRYLFDHFSLVPWLTVYDGQRNIIYLCSHYVYDRLMFNTRTAGRKFGICVTPKAMWRTQRISNQYAQRWWLDEAENVYMVQRQCPIAFILYLRGAVILYLRGAVILYHYLKHFGTSTFG